MVKQSTLFGLVLLTACEGGVSEPAGFDPYRPAEQRAVAPFAPDEAVLPRLTTLQYRTTLENLFGADLPATPIEPDSNPFLFQSIGSTRTTLSERGAQQYEEAAMAVAHHVMGVMTELLAVALKCDLTRVFTMMLTSPATNHVFGNVGVAGAMHQICHDGNWEEVRRITEYQMQCFARFLDVMAATTEVTGESLLDQMCIYATSEYGEGTTHSNHEHPVMLAGGAGGAMNTGTHYREEGGNLGRVHLTILKAMGIDVSSYGFNGGETSDPLPVLA
jgi:hypothetical protein